MAIVTTLTIRALEVQYSLSGLDDVVIDVGATLSGNDSGHTAEVSGGFKIASPVLSSFVPYDSLTETDVANFVKATSTYTTLHNGITSQIWQDMQPPTQGTLPLPWE